MNVVVKENFKTYSATIELHYGDVLTEINSCIDSIVQRTNNLPINFEFIINSDFDVYSGTSVTDLKAEISGEYGHWNEEGSNAVVYITVNKGSSTLIIDEKAFVSEIKSYEVAVQLRLLKNNFFGSSPMRSIENEKIKQLSDVSKNRYKSDITPVHINHLIESIPSGDYFGDYLTTLRTILSFSMMLEHVEVEKNNINAFASKDIIFSIESVKDYSTSMKEVVYRVFLWCFEDESHKLKSSVFSTVISVQACPENSLDDRLLSILKSNFNILLKDNFDLYLEARSSVLDFIFDLSNKLKEQLTEHKSAFNNTLMVALSFLFTSIVFTTIDKGKFINVFTIQVNILITVFIWGALLYTYVKQRDIEEILIFHLQQRDEFKKRYTSIFSKEELDDLFEPKSLNILIDRIKSRTTMYLYHAFFLGINALIIFLYIHK